MVKLFKIHSLPEHQDIQKLLSLEKKYLKKTLGQLIKNLREEINLSNHFEKTIESFLIHRNEFVHNLVHRKDFGLNGPQANETYSFVHQLYTEAKIVVQVFWSCIRNWSDMTLGMDSKFFEGLDFVE